MNFPLINLLLQNVTWLEPQLPPEETTHPPSLSTSVNVAPEVAVK